MPVMAAAAAPTETLVSAPSSEYDTVLLLLPETMVQDPHTTRKRTVRAFPRRPRTALHSIDIDTPPPYVSRGSRRTDPSLLSDEPLLGRAGDDTRPRRRRCWKIPPERSLATRR